MYNHNWENKWLKVGSNRPIFMTIDSQITQCGLLELLNCLKNGEIWCISIDMLQMS